MRQLRLPALPLIAACTMALAGCSDAAGASGGTAAGAAESRQHERLTGTDRAAASAGQDEAALLDKADRSFSELAFGMTREDAAPMQLREVMRDGCESNGTCFWLIASAPHVRHYFDENGEVTSKHIYLDDYGNGELRALGIGDNRIKEYVVDAVKAFVPGMPISCRSVDEAGEGDGRSSCSGSLGEANIKMIFHDADILTEVHIYRYTGI